MSGISVISAILLTFSRLPFGYCLGIRAEPDKGLDMSIVGEV